MLSPKRESLAGKLLLSSALVAVSLAYGWWQRPADGPTLAMAQAPLPPGRPAPVPHSSPATPPIQPAVQDAGSAAAPSRAADGSAKTPAVAKMAPQASAPALAPAAPEPQQDIEPSTTASPPALTPQQALQMYVPMDGASPPLALVTGNPEPGAMVPVPAGAHLADCDCVSDRHGLMWGDLRVMISIHGGLITGVQVLQFPDHRSQSLYLSQMALPVLASEVIKSQKAQVDVVSSATDTSYTFQDAVADAIAKATRG